MGKALIITGLSGTPNLGKVTFIESADIEAISIIGADSISGMRGKYSVDYAPAGTPQVGVTWSVVSGGSYATIDNNGNLTIKEGASNSQVTIKATSTYNPSITAEKTIRVTYEFIVDTLDSLAIIGSDNVSGTEAHYNVEYTPEGTIRTGVTWSITNGSAYAEIGNDGTLIILPAATSASSVTIKATSTYDPSITATKVVSVKYSNAIAIDPKVLAIGIANGWDKDGDGSISVVEAKAVTTFGDIFKGSDIETFDASQFTGVKSIAMQAFKDCKSLTSLILPDTVTELGRASVVDTYSPFRGCTALESIHIPIGMTYIPPFRNCTALREINIPESVTTLANSNGIFYGCTSLSLTSLPSGITAFGTDCFYNCTSIKLTSVPSGVTAIPSNCFHGAGIESMTLPEGVTTIDAGAFSDCASCKVISFPSTLTTINNRDIVWGCSNLEAVIFKATTPPTRDDFTLYMSNKAYLYVPDTSVDAYKAAYTQITAKIKPMSELPAEYRG